MIGETVGPYRITAELGGGGMGVVYRGEDVRLGRPVAVKFLPPALSADRAARERQALLPASIVPVASVSLARALAAAGDAAGAREAYQYFLEFWKRADPDVPLLVQARKEFAALGEP